MAWTSYYESNNMKHERFIDSDRKIGDENIKVDRMSMKFE